MLLVLQDSRDAYDAVHARVIPGPQHPVDALARLIELFAEFDKGDGRVDVVAQHGLADIDISFKNLMA